ncbi:hypothetical protein V8D89_004944 [Ganoderma adspersum]
MQNWCMLSVQTNSDDRLAQYARLREPQSWMIASNRAEEKSTAICFYPLWTRPVGHTSTFTSGLTIIGDVAHITIPSSGAGENRTLSNGLGLGLPFDPVDLEASCRGSEMDWRVALVV